MSFEKVLHAAGGIVSKEVLKAIMEQLVSNIRNKEETSCRGGGSPRFM